MIYDSSHDAELSKGDQDGDEMTDAEYQEAMEQRDADRYYDMDRGD